MSKAQGLSVQTLVVIIIAVIVLVSIILLYTGQVSGLFGQISTVGTASGSAATTSSAKIGSVGAGFGQPCSQAVHCRSDVCTANKCAKGANGKPCMVNDDCTNICCASGTNDQYTCQANLGACA